MPALGHYGQMVGRSTSLLWHTALVAAAAALLLASCSSAAHRGAAGAVGAPKVSTAASSTTFALASPGATVAPAGAVTPSSTETASPSGSVATPSGGSQSVHSQPGSTSTYPAASSPGGEPPTPAVPGTYVVDQSGGVTTSLPGYSSSEPPQGKLVVDPAQQDGVQVEHRYVDPNQPPADTTLRFLASGPVVVSLTEGSGSAGVSCTFDPPIPAPPWPPAVGKSFSSQGNCGNGTTASVRGQITAAKSAKLADGEVFPVWVIDSVVDMQGKIQAQGTQEDWYSPALRLAVHEHIHMSGTYSGVGFTLDSTWDLASSHPS